MKIILLILVVGILITAVTAPVFADHISAHFTSGSRKWQSYENGVYFYNKSSWADSGTMRPSCSLTGGHYLRCKIGNRDTGRVVSGYGFYLESDPMYGTDPNVYILYTAYAYYGTA